MISGLPVNKTAFVFAVFFLLLSGSIIGDLQWQNFTRGNEVHALTGSPECIWVATNGGAIKIDKSNGERTFYNHGNSGIPDNQVTDVLVDHNGNTWLTAGNASSTGGGLAKFDGENWMVYNTFNSDLPSNKLSSILLGSDHSVWVGSDQGLIQINSDLKIIPYNTWNSELPDDRILSLGFGFRDNIWVGTMNGLAVYDWKNGNWTVYTMANSPLPSNEIRAITFEGNIVWIGTSAGLVKFDGINWDIFDPANSGLPNYFVNDIAIDESRRKWVGTDDGLALFDKTQWTIYSTSNSELPSNKIQSILIDEDGTKWIGTFSGLVGFDDESWKLYSTSNSDLPDNIVTSVAWQSEDIIWVGTVNGLARYDGNFWTVFNTSNSILPNNTITCITIDNSQDTTSGLQSLWIGTHDGLVFHDGEDWKLYNTSNSGLSNNNITSIAIDSYGNKWIGTGYGLSKFDGRQWITYLTTNSGLPDDFVITVAVEDNNSIWVGTFNGLGRFDGHEWQSFYSWNSELPHDIITALTIDTEGNKWIGCVDHTGRALVKYDADWTIYTTSNSELPDYDIASLTFDGEHNKIWIGTWMGGLANYDGENWKAFDVFNSGLSHNVVTSIAADNSNNHWIGTNGGLTRLREISSAPFARNLNEESILNTETKELREPNSFSLSKNYPNPFNPTTTIAYQVPRQSEVRINIYNMLGQKVRTLLNERKEHGEYKAVWDGRNDSGTQVGSGVYLYRMVAGDHVQVRKMILMK